MQLLCPRHVRLLTALGATTEQHDQLRAILGEIDPKAGPQSIRYSPMPPHHLTFEVLPVARRIAAVATFAAA
jgi:hypothetical protein